VSVSVVSFPNHPHLSPHPLLRHGRPCLRKVKLPMHVHVLPPRHARGLRQTLRKSKRERIVRQDALHRHQGARANHLHHHRRRRPITHSRSFVSFSPRPSVRPSVCPIPTPRCLLCNMARGERGRGWMDGWEDVGVGVDADGHERGFFFCFLTCTDTFVRGWIWNTRSRVRPASRRSCASSSTHHCSATTR
jgi:hypothetical protein